MIFRHFLLFGFFFYFQSLSAQQYHHNTFWGRVVFVKEWKNGYLINADYHYRTQNNYKVSETNIFKAPLLLGERIIGGYRHKRWLYSLGISHWKTNVLLGKEADFLKTPTAEWRLTPSIEKTWRPNQKWLFHSRTQEDIRWLNKQIIGRFRQRFQVRYFINKNDFFTLGDEILVGTAPNSSKKLEQNQVSFLFQKHFSAHIESELGYRHLFRQRRNSVEVDLENALIWSVFYRL